MSPSLRGELTEMILDEASNAQQDAAATLQDYHEEPVVEIAGLTFTEQQVLQRWFPDEAL